MTNNNQPQICVLISGNGSNLQAIINAIAKGILSCQISAVISNQAQAYGLIRAQQHGIKTYTLQKQDFPSRTAYDQALFDLMRQISADLFVLAGFMHILPATIIHAFRGKLLNIHPSLLPKYPGLHTHGQVLAAEDKEHGCSIHFVTEQVDGGPIIAQDKFLITAKDDVESLKNKVHQLEHHLYPQIIAKVLSGELCYPKIPQSYP
jgi:phosphoribosylglycinamide formyltransferase 1